MCVSVTLLYDYRKANALASARPRIACARVLELLKRYLPAVITLVCYGAVVSVARQQFEVLRGAEALGMYAAVATPTVLVQVAASYLYNPLLGGGAVVSVARQQFEVLRGAEALGMYAAVATPTVLVQVAASYLYNPLLGGIAQRWSDRDLAAFLRGIGSVFVAILVVAAAGVLASELFGEPVLTFVYSESIRGSVYLLTPALIATAVTTMFAFMFDVLIVMRSLRAALVANASALLISIVASRPMIEAAR